MELYAMLARGGELRRLRQLPGDDGFVSGDPQLLSRNSPLETVDAVASGLLRAHTYVWFYSGTTDRLRGQNRAFEAELARLGIAHRFFLVSGGHDWGLWRGEASLALLAAATHLAHA